MNNIETNRLLLIPITLEIAGSLLIGSIEETEKLGLKTNGNWPREDTMDILPIIHEALKKYRMPTGFELWMIVDKSNMVIIGDIGFYGKPDKNGDVTVGYGLIENERGKGYGYEALSAIINWAISREDVRKVRADCLIDNIASARILEKSGMKEIDRKNGIIYWEINK